MNSEIIISTILRCLKMESISCKSGSVKITLLITNKGSKQSIQQSETNYKETVQPTLNKFTTYQRKTRIKIHPQLWYFSCTKPGEKQRKLQRKLRTKYSIQFSKLMTSRLSKGLISSSFWPTINYQDKFYSCTTKWRMDSSSSQDLSSSVEFLCKAQLCPCEAC